VASKQFFDAVDEGRDPEPAGEDNLGGIGPVLVPNRSATGAESPSTFPTSQ
jgi:hypothetical protein